MRLLVRRMPLLFAALVLTLALATGGTAVAGSAPDAGTAAEAAAKKKGKKKKCGKKKKAKRKSPGQLKREERRADRLDRKGRSADAAAKKRGKKGKKKCGKKKKKKAGRKSPGELKRDRGRRPTSDPAKCEQAKAEVTKAAREHNETVAAAQADGTIDEAEKAQLAKTFAAIQAAKADERKYC